MKNSTEFELKRLLTENEYTEFMGALLEVAGGTTIIQINYYYDDTEFNIFHKDETLRIRQIGAKLTLERKFNKRQEDSVRICDEDTNKIDLLPKMIIMNGFQYRNIGSMTTLRTNFSIDNVNISLDKNFYLGTVDYEIEVEYKCLNKMLPILKNILFSTKNAIGKYSRFIKLFRTIIDKYEI